MKSFFKMKNLIPQFLILAIIFLTGINSCKSPTSSCDDCPEKPDTTSHNFQITVDTIGNAGSILWDVAIVNDTNIWVVGDITKYPYDSQERWNAAQWDGKKWNKKRILLKQFNEVLWPNIIYTTFITPDNELWVVGSGSWAKTKIGEENWTTDYFREGTGKGSISKIWGTSSSNLYFVGSNGSITYYDGENFTLVDSGTDVSLTDIYGTPDGKEVWACGYDQLSKSGLVRKSGNKFELIWYGEPGNEKPPYGRHLSSLWTDGREEFRLSGAGKSYRQSFKDLSKCYTDSIKTNTGTEALYFGGRIERIRGNASNDVFAVGIRGIISHWNGSNWFNYKTSLTEDDILRSVSVTNKLNIAVGNRSYSFENSPALILTMKR